MSLTEGKKETFVEAMKRSPDLGEQHYFWCGFLSGALAVVGMLWVTSRLL